MKEKIVLVGNPDGCFQPFESHQEQSDAQTTNSCDPERNKDLHFWKDYLTRNPDKGKQILEKYYYTTWFPAENPLLQWDFLNSFNLTIRDTTLVALIIDWSWKETKIYLQKQMDLGIIFTLFEWDGIFRYHPQAAEQLPVPWDDFTPDDWAGLLRNHPQLADRCPFNKFMPQQWVRVLASRPEMESRGVCFDQFTRENWKELCERNPDFTSHRENWTLRDELRPAFFLKNYFFKHKNLLIDLSTAENLCNGDEKSYQIRGVETKTGHSKTEALDREEINRILEPFRHEQEMVYRFLSSGDTKGIMIKIYDKYAKKLPLHNRYDLENLIAIVRPGPLIFWEDYRDNRPCRLEMASGIAKRTRGVLLYKDQIEDALQLLTGCPSEETLLLLKKNYGILIHQPYYEQLFQLIENHNGVTREKAEELRKAWGGYAANNWGIRYDKIAKTANRIYLRALEYLRDKGEIPPDSVK